MHRRARYCRASGNGTVKIIHFTGRFEAARPGSGKSTCDMDLKHIHPAVLALQGAGYKNIMLRICHRWFAGLWWRAEFHRTGGGDAVSNPGRARYRA